MEALTQWNNQLIDEIARCGYLGVVWGINGGATTGGAPIASYGTPEQKRKYLAPLLRGQQKHCLMVTEPDGKLSQEISNRAQY